jgi:hypothetical protein
MTIFLKMPEKLMGANKYDKMNQLKHAATLHNILQTCGQY